MIGWACKTNHGNEKCTQNFGWNISRDEMPCEYTKKMEGKMNVNRQVQASVRWQAFVTMLMTIWLYKNTEIADPLTCYSFIKKDLHHASLRGVTFNL